MGIARKMRGIGVMYMNCTIGLHQQTEKREVKHLKGHWTKIKRWVALLCGSWKKATSIYLSGYSDEQLKDMAKQFYLDDY
jgi:hypothetical protein